MGTTVEDSQTGRGCLLVIPWDLHEPGGVSQVVLNLYRELGALGWSPSVLVTTWGSPAPELDASGAVPVYRWRIRPPWLPHRPFISVISFLAALPGIARTWRRLARSLDWQLVNIHYPGLTALTWIALRRSGLWRGKVVISVHGREVRDVLHGAGRIERWLMRQVFQYADAIIACTRELASDVIQLAPEARDVLETIPNGVSQQALAAEFDSAFEMPAALATRRFILNVATFEHKKAQDVLVDAFVPIAAATPDVDLVLVGRSTPWIDEIRRRVSASGVAGRIHIFTDVPHRHVLTFLSRATLFCLPSRAEGHPLAILEAATFGLPVVAASVGGIPSTIPDDAHGLLVPASNVEALTDSLSRVLGDDELARTLGGNLRRLVESEFSWTRSAGRYSELARRLVDGSRSSPTPP